MLSCRAMPYTVTLLRCHRLLRLDIDTLEIRHADLPHISPDIIYATAIMALIAASYDTLR